MRLRSFLFLRSPHGIPSQREFIFVLLPLAFVYNVQRFLEGS